MSFAQRNSPTCSRQRLLTRRLARRCGELPTNKRPLRRVATQVAAAAPPNAVFAGVAEEVGRLLSVDRAYVARYDADGAVTVVAAWSATGETLPIGPIGRTRARQRERAGA